MEVENKDPAQHAKWLAKHGFNPNESGEFTIDSFEGKLPVETDTLFENIATNVRGDFFHSLEQLPYDDRTFVMVCGGPSVADHLPEIRRKSLLPDQYLVVCSNLTGKYLLENGITPHAHFIIDPQEKKKYDLSVVSEKTDYWINVACHPAVFETLRAKGITPYAFLADFDSSGRTIETIKQHLSLDKAGLAVIQGGTMAGLRAINIADALGFRRMEYYGFDATVRLSEGKAQPYAYDKKRGEAIIEVACDQCSERFDTTLIFQSQVNEFLSWRRNMPWMDIKIIGGGLIDHCSKHYDEMLASKPKVTYRYTEAYKRMQEELHDHGGYGVAGAKMAPALFNLSSQLVKRLGSCSVLDYGSSVGRTMQAVRDSFPLHPNIMDRCYDPFVAQFAAEPAPADLVICTDVLEHVEPECTDAVLDHIQSLTARVAFITIGMVPAVKTLSDGRNAHINLHDSEYWCRELAKRFIISEIKSTKETLFVIAQSISDVASVVK